MSTVAPTGRAASTPFFFDALQRAVGPTLARRFSRPGFVRLILVILLFLAWEIGVRLFGDPLFLSPPSEVVGGMIELAHDPAVVGAVVTTFVEIFIAFGLAVVVGIVIGLAVGLQGFTRRSIFPIIVLLYATPQVVFLPLVILYFGIGPVSKIFFGFSHGVFAIIVTVVAGVQNINPVLLTAARSMGASRRQVLRWVIFPHMVPSLFTGMRLGMTGVLLGVLLAELYVSAGGIGYYTRLFTDTFVPSKVFALIGVLSFFAVCLNEAARKAEQHFQKWRG